MSGNDHVTSTSINKKIDKVHNFFKCKNVIGVSECVWPSWQ